MPETMKLPLQARNAILRAESYDADANTVEVVWTTGAAVLRYDWDGSYLETLDVTTKAVRLERLNLGAPFLNMHQNYDLACVNGCVVPDSARIEGGEGIALIKLSQSTRAADTVRDIKDGVIRNVSVGYIVHQVVRTEGKDGAPATCRVTDWEPYELSAVPIPADANAQIRSATHASERTLFPCLVHGEVRGPEPTLASPAIAAARARMRAKIRRLSLSPV